jgi:hypothetical protein
MIQRKLVDAKATRVNPLTRPSSRREQTKAKRMRLDILVGLAASATSAFAAPQELEKRAGFTWTGVNVAGGEFGNKDLPGQLGKHYTWPEKGALDTLMNDGVNIFRVACMMERVVPTRMTGTVNETYFQGLLDVSFDAPEPGTRANTWDSPSTTSPESKLSGAPASAKTRAWEWWSNSLLQGCLCRTRSSQLRYVVDTT